MTALHEVTGFDVPVTCELSIPRQRTAAPAAHRRVAASRHSAPVPSPRPVPTGSHRRIPAPRTEALVAVAPIEVASRASAVADVVAQERPTKASPRRPSVLLGALVTGGLVAGFFGVHNAGGAAAESTSVLAAQQALVSEEQGLDVKPMASITEAEAQARLQEVAASRAERQAEAQAAAEAAEAAAREAARPKTVLPVRGARLTSTYGPRWGTFHYGIDLAAPMRTPEYAVADGVVLRAGPASGFGLAVYILHENGDVTVYGHMDSISVAPGDYVQAGDQIALLGNRGQSTGPHLHFEVHRGGEDGERINPVTWLAARGVHL
jgi:murein DD-endopeptidase MepM/ murein hydrolase activator NlpD